TVIKWPRRRIAPVRRSCTLRRRAEMLREKGERSAIGEVGSGLVVARRAGVVVEGVLGAGIGVERIGLVVGFERRLVGRDPGVHGFVGFGVVQQQRGLDVGDLRRRNLAPVIGDAGVELGAR